MVLILKQLMTVGSFSILLPTIVLAIRWTDFRKEQIPTAYLVIFSCIMEVATLLVSHVLRMPNLFLFHLYTLVEIWLVLWIFQTGISSKFIKNWGRWLAGAFSLFYISRVLYLGNWVVFNSLGRIIESIIVIGLAGHYYFITTRELKTKHLESSPMFWIVNALFIYFAASFLIFLLSDWMMNNNQLVGLYTWALHAFLGILKNLFFAAALWIKHPSLK